jgi:hypothetical protein
LLAEAVLTDVDNFLLRLGVPFTRFVDDFRIFCTSKREAVRIHHDLVEYVYTSHRLILEPWKTQIVAIKQFIAQELVDPGEIERSSRVEKIRALLDQILFESGYSVGEEDLLDRDKDRAVKENLIELFEECVEKRHFTSGWLVTFCVEQPDCVPWPWRKPYSKTLLGSILSSGM